MALQESKFLEYVDRKAIARIGGNPLLTNFAMEGNVSGHHKSNHKGSSVEFAEYREYTEGEDPRQMDWKVLARTDKYFLKEFEAETNLRAHQVLDCSASMNFGKPISKLEYAKRMVGTLTYAYLNQGDAVGLSLLQASEHSVLPARRNPSQLHDILSTLGQAKASGNNQLVTQLHQVAETVKSRALLLVFSDFFEDPEIIRDAIHHLRDRKHEVVLFNLMDQQELEFVFDRPTRFIDLEGGSSILTEPSVIRDEYLKQMREHMNQIKKICAETQSSFHQVVTDAEIDDALSVFSFQRTQF